MAYRILIKQSAEKELDALPRKMYDRIVDRLLVLEETPRPVGIKKLRGQESYRLRVGDYRILYTIEDKTNTVTIYAIGHRRDIYR